MAFLGLRYALDQWAAYGIFDVLLPLILVFAIIFSILQRTKILGGSKQLDSVVAFIISLFVVMNPVVTSLFAPIFSQTGLALIIMVAIMIIVGLVMGEGKMSDAVKWMIGVGGVAIFVWLLSAVSGFYPIYMWFPISNYWWDSNQLLVISGLILVVGLALIIFGPKGGSTAEKKP